MKTYTEFFFMINNWVSQLYESSIRRMLFLYFHSLPQIFVGRSLTRSVRFQKMVGLCAKVISDTYFPKIAINLWKLEHAAVQITFSSW